MRPEQPPDGARSRKAGKRVAAFLAVLAVFGLAGIALLAFVISTCRMK